MWPTQGISQARNFTVDPLSPTTLHNVSYDQSVFITSGCSYWFRLPSKSAPFYRCFLMVFWFGDSLTRHAVQGLMMLWTEDLVYGAIPRLTPLTQLYDRCKCDGQFSEHDLCRNHSIGSEWFLPDPRMYGLCVVNPSHRFSFSYSWMYPDRVLDTFCSDDPRPRFVMVQGGIHSQSNASRTINEYFLPLLRAINLLE